MTTTMDNAGRVVIPSKVRRQAGLQPGTPLEISYRDGRVEIEPALMPMRLERERGLLVVVPEVPLPPAPDGLVEETIAALRAERMSIE